MTTIMVEVSLGYCWQDGGSEVGVFGGHDNSRHGDCGGGVVE